jgi:hypothetical protein
MGRCSAAGDVDGDDVADERLVEQHEHVVGSQGPRVVVRCLTGPADLDTAVHAYMGQGAVDGDDQAAALHRHVGQRLERRRRRAVRRRGVAVELELADPAVTPHLLLGRGPGDGGEALGGGDPSFPQRLGSGQPGRSVGTEGGDGGWGHGWTTIRKDRADTGAGPRTPGPGLPRSTNRCSARAKVTHDKFRLSG